MQLVYCSTWICWFWCGNVGFRTIPQSHGSSTKAKQFAGIFKARKASMVPRNALRAGCVSGARPAALPRGAVMQVTWRGGRPWWKMDRLREGQPSRWFSDSILGFLGVKKKCVGFRSVTKDVIPPWACWRGGAHMPGEFFDSSCKMLQRPLKIFHAVNCFTSFLGSFWCCSHHMETLGNGIELAPLDSAVNFQIQKIM